MSIGKQIHAFLEVSEMFLRQSHAKYSKRGTETIPNVRRLVD